MMEPIEIHLTLLQEYDSLPEIEHSKSIFDVAGYPHYENVCSNILAFYLDPSNEHGLGNLFLTALMELFGEGNPDPDSILINREVTTKNGGRLDLLIETETQMIGIENKIRHVLNNDLADYSRSLEAWAKPNQLEVVKILLSIKKEKVSSGFKLIKYEQLWEKIREYMGKHITTSSQKWLLYLADFMSTIDNLMGDDMEFNKIDQFFIENEDRIRSLISDRNKFLTKLHDRIKQLEALMELHTECTNRWIYNKTCLVHDFILSGNKIAFDFFISPKGWKLIVWGRNKDSRSYLTELMSTKPLSSIQSEMYGNRYIIDRFDLDANLDTIGQKLLVWFEKLFQAQSNLQKNM